MESALDKKKQLRFIDVQCVDEIKPADISLSVKSSTETVILGLGDMIEIQDGSLEVQLLDNQNNYEPVIVSITEDSAVWFQLSASISVKLSLKSPPSNPLPKRLPILQITSGKPSNCNYIKKIQEIEAKQKEITSLLYESKKNIPEAYKDFLESTPTTAKRVLLKKKTADIETILEPDYTFQSYFDISLENFTASEVDLLNNTALGLLTKSQALELDVEEYEVCQETLIEFESPIKNLVDSVNESKEQFETEESKGQKLFEDLEAEIQSLEQEISDAERKNLEIELEIQGVNQGVSRQIEENNSLAVQDLDGEISETHKLRGSFAEILNDIKLLEDEYSVLLKEFQSYYPEQELVMAINEKILKLSELHRITSTRDAALIENIEYQSELLRLQGELDLKLDIDAQTYAYTGEASLYSLSTQNLSSHLQKINQDRSEDLERSKKAIEDLSDSLNPIEDQVTTSEELIKEKQTLLDKTNDQLLEIKKNNHKLEIVLDREKQIISEFVEFNGVYLNSLSIQKSVFNEIEYISNSLLLLSDNSLTAGRLLRRAEDMAEEQELQQISIYRLIGLIKETKPAHIAVQNDSTDMALAKYLNTRHKALEINFKRTEKEKYTFGTLKVEIKYEDEIFVLLDGKKIKIEDFIELYTPIEKDKGFKRSNSKIQDKKEPKVMIKTGKSPLIALGQILKKAK
jgi:hypothetical protein